MRRSPAEVQAAREAKLDEMAEKLETAVAGLTTGEDWRLIPVEGVDGV